MATSFSQRANLPSCLARRETRQIRCGHDWWSKKQTFRFVYVTRQKAVICGQNGYFTSFIYENRCEFEQCKIKIRSRLYFLTKHLSQLLAISN